MERASTAAETDLYDRDFALWVKAQADALRAGRLSAVDVENVVEELEALAKRDRREIKNRLSALGAHLLKRLCQSENASRSWDATIIEQSQRIRRVLADSPSLVREMPDFIVKAYPEARELASAETGKPLADFPERPPFLFIFDWCDRVGVDKLGIVDVFKAIGDPNSSVTVDFGVIGLQAIKPEPSQEVSD